MFHRRSLQVALSLSALFFLALPPRATAQEDVPGKLPTGVILVKGAEPSSSDSSTPLPEDGTVTRGLFTNRYFGLSYHLPADWTQKYAGPPPSDGANYVLAQFEPSASFKGENRATILITAQDLFFARNSGAAMDAIQSAGQRLPWRRRPGGTRW